MHDESFQLVPIINVAVNLSLCSVHFDQPHLLLLFAGKTSLAVYPRTFSPESMPLRKTLYHFVKSEKGTTTTQRHTLQRHCRHKRLYLFITIYTINNTFITPPLVRFCALFVVASVVDGILLVRLLWSTHDPL